MINIIDNKFYKLTNELKVLDKQKIYENIKNYFENLPIQIKFELEDYFAKNEYDEFINRAEIISYHIDEFIYLYNNLYDYRSKKLLLAILNNLYNFDFNLINHSKETNFYRYIDLDIIDGTYNSVIVDTDAKDGSFILNYIEAFNNNYEKIYSYIYDKNDMDIFNNRLLMYKNIIINKKEMIDEEISLLKVSKDSSNIINKFKDRIIKDKPKIIINLSDIKKVFSLVKLILSINSEYKFYLRCYDSFSYNYDIVLLAIID